MNVNNESHFLSLNHSIINTSGLEQLVSMWSVISKCKNHLEEGTRLENMSWRLWHQKHQQYFVKPILSLSAGNLMHEVSQAKQTQKHHVPDKDGWSLPPTKAESAGSTHALVPSTNSRTTTPSLSNSYQYGDEDMDDYDDDDDLYDEDYDESIYDNDDLYDENDNYIYDEAEFMRTEKLRPSQHYEKTRPRRLQQPSLLSALFKTSSSSSSTMESYRHTFPSRVANAPPDHFLKKELTESLRDNVLWEHVQQQKPLYPSYYHPPPSSTYQSPYRQNKNHRPPFKKTMVPSDQGWLESFHGW